MSSQKINGSKITGAVDFIISRKRKLYKFARFNELDNCFHLEEWADFVNRSNIFDQKRIVAEVGAGSALFLVEQAKLFPDKLFIAVDVKSDRLFQGARQAKEDGVENIYFVRSRVEEVAQIFLSKSVSEIWLTFSDPYPRKSDTKHRLTYKRYLDLYKEILSANGELHFKTDSRDLFEYSCESLAENNWKEFEKTNDLHGSDLADNYKIMTSYEVRFVTEGRNIYFLSARPY